MIFHEMLYSAYVPGVMWANLFFHAILFNHIAVILIVLPIVLLIKPCTTIYKSLYLISGTNHQCNYVSLNIF